MLHVLSVPSDFTLAEQKDLLQSCRLCLQYFVHVCCTVLQDVIIISSIMQLIIVRRFTFVAHVLTVISLDKVFCTDTHTHTQPKETKDPKRKTQNIEL